MKKNYFFFALGMALCATTFAQVPVVNPIIGPSSVCQDKSQAYTITSSNSPTSYHWSVSPTGGITIANPNDQQTFITFPVNSNDSVPYTVKCYASNGSGNGPQVTLTVWAVAVPHFSCTGRVFCKGLTATVTASSPSHTNTSYHWVPATGLNTTNSATVLASPSVTTIYTITAANGSCKYKDTVTVFAEACVGIRSNGSIAGAEVSVYPNPNNGGFVLKTTQPGAASIINELGQIVQSLNISPDAETRITGLLPGIYFIVGPDWRKKIMVTATK